MTAAEEAGGKVRYLDGAAGRAVIVKALHTTVDAEGGGVEEAVLQELLEASPAKAISTRD